MADDEAIRRVLQARADVRLAYLFGSVASGHASPRSDVDVAVLFSGSPSLEERDGLLAELERAARRRVDLIDLQEASPLLVREVVTTGQRLLCRDEALGSRFETRAIMRYLDTAHLRRLQYAYLEERARSRRARAT